MRLSFPILAFVGVVAAAAGSAQAAGSYGPVAPPAGGYWEGVYVGVQGGTLRGTASFTAPGETVPFGTLDINGWAGGVRAGVDYQSGALVFGLLGDVMASNASKTVTDFGGSGSDVTGKIDWTGSVRGRVGYAMNNALIYGTAGVGFAHVSSTVSNLAPGDLESGSASNVHTGWTAGIGAELALTSNISLLGEWTYSDYGTQNYHFQDTAGTIDADTKLTGNTFLVGINMRLR